MKPGLVIFDFDGTLVDSEPNYANCNDTVFKKIGIEMSAKEVSRYVGISTENFSQILVKDFNLSISVKELMQMFNESYMQLARSNTPVYEPSVELLKRFHNLGIDCAIASGSSQHVLEELVDICEFRPYLKGIFSSEHVANGKPAPDIFLYTAEKLGVNRENCLVFEDSMPGVFAAHQANMRVVALPIEEEFAHPAFQGAWLTFPGAQRMSTKAVLSALGLPHD